MDACVVVVGVGAGCLDAIALRRITRLSLAVAAYCAMCHVQALSARLPRVDSCVAGPGLPRVDSCVPGCNSTTSTPVLPAIATLPMPRVEPDRHVAADRCHVAPTAASVVRVAAAPRRQPTKSAPRAPRGGQTVHVDAVGRAPRGETVPADVYTHVASVPADAGPSRADPPPPQVCHHHHRHRRHHHHHHHDDDCDHISQLAAYLANCPAHEGAHNWAGHNGHNNGHNGHTGGVGAPRVDRSEIGTDVTPRLNALSHMLGSDASQAPRYTAEI